MTQKLNSSSVVNRSSSENVSAANSTHPNPSSPPHLSASGERTVKKLQLSKALMIPEGTTVSEACSRMAAMRVDAVLLTDANSLVLGIATDKDITIRVIAEDLKPEKTIISEVMTRKLTCVSADSSTIDALQKMVQGKFRHLPVIENGEVTELLGITKCLDDALQRMYKAAEQGIAIAAAVEGVQCQFGSNLSASSTLIETLLQRMFKPSLSTIISENSRFAIVLLSDPVQVAVKKMRELRVNSVLIMNGNTIKGILTSKDILMKVVAKSLSPELTLVEKVMTADPERATVETTILEALRMMREGKFLHLPVVDKDGIVAACLDVLQIIHAALSVVEMSSGTVKNVESTVMQKFLDSAPYLKLIDDTYTHSEMSVSQYVASDGTKHLKSFLPVANSFSFKLKDHKGCVHRFDFGTESLSELVSAVIQRVGASSDDQRRLQFLYEDDEGDKVLLTTDGDLVGAVARARSVEQKVLKIYLEYNHSIEEWKEPASAASLTTKERRSSPIGFGVFVASVGVLVYLTHSKT